MKKHTVLFLCGSLAIGNHLYASDEKAYSPWVVEATNTRVYWGDTHLHTSFSADAGMIGNTLGPEQAYRFAKGQEITTSSGQRARLIRPLDFLVVSDHAENLGLAPMIAESNPELLKTQNGKRLHDLVKDGKGHDAFMVWVTEGLSKNKDLIDNAAMGQTIWERSLDISERHNQPEQFTALLGFEWTSINTPEVPSNLHRVVIFRDDATKAKQVLPFTAYDSYDPEDLWDYMEAYEKTTGAGP